MDYVAVFQAVLADPRYLRNVEWGEARPGHPEGSVRAHIEELEQNLERLRSRLSGQDVQKLRLLIHVHDAFKAEAKPEVAIVDPASHASLARAFLAEFCHDADLLMMVQYHDEPFALWRQLKHKDRYDSRRMQELLGNIQDWNLFLAFLIIDGCTPGKGREPLFWFFREIAEHVQCHITAGDIIEAAVDSSD